METFPFDSWAGRWAVHARDVPHGEVVAALLVDLAADPRGVYLAPSVAFPLALGARALGVPAVLVRTALHQLRKPAWSVSAPRTTTRTGRRCG